MNKIDFHADDYGLSVNNSKRIIELIDSGKLNSISIIANMGCFDECIQLLKEKWVSWEVKPLISVHINLIDGYTLSKSDSTITSSSLKNDNPSGKTTNGSWGNLFLHSFFSSANLKRELTAEIKAQILAVRNALPFVDELRLDSHVHTHMIPVVFDSMMCAVDELGLNDKVTFIRNSREPLIMFLTTSEVRGTFPIVNTLKNIILNILSIRVTKKLRKLNLPKAMLWGLIMSGQMDSKRVKKLSPSMQSYASKRDNYLEILCHPGIVLDSEIRPEYGKADLSFILSPNRDVEYSMVDER